MSDGNGLIVRAVGDPRYSPNDMERDAQAIIDELTQLRKAEQDPAKRKHLNKRLKCARIVRDWSRSRAGYVG